VNSSFQFIAIKYKCQYNNKLGTNWDEAVNSASVQEHTMDLESREGKGKVHPVTCPDSTERRVETKLCSFFEVSTTAGWVVNAMIRQLYLLKSPGTHHIGGWVDPKGRSGQLRKIPPLPQFNPRTIQPVASRYIDYAISAHQQVGT